MTNNLPEQVYHVRISVFKGKYQDAIEGAIQLLGDLMKEPEFDQFRIKEIATLLMQSIQNKDYLLMADVVYFEIPPLWNGTTDEIDAFLSRKGT